MTTVEGPMKSMQYVMPIMFLFMMNNFPAGLTYYYFLSNLFTLGQQSVIRKMVDDKKIRKMLEENKVKNKDKKGKSSFQQKLSDAMKASQEAQKKNKKK